MKFAASVLRMSSSAFIKMWVDSTLSDIGPWFRQSKSICAQILNPSRLKSCSTYIKSVRNDRENILKLYAARLCSSLNCSANEASGSS
jgi:hypothetical protein